jgi:hypothetical protein
MYTNTPWVESVFFEEELRARSLSAEQAADARFYNQHGFLHLKGVFDDVEVAEVLGDLQSRFGERFSYMEPRASELWEESEAVKKLATHKVIMEKLQLLYGRRPIPFQTLNFKYGSRQKPHSDTIHFSSHPARFMCGVWVALDDVDAENGGLLYFPGSHKLDIADYTAFQKDFERDTLTHVTQDYIDFYEPYIQQKMKANGLQPETLVAKKGDVLIWAANLVHGGLPVVDKSRTRWSQVTHYYFEDCLYYTPQLSNPVAGEWFLREITDVTTGEKTWGSYNGHPVRRKRAAQYRFLISRDASYNWRDARHFLEKVYHKLFKK